MVVSWTFPVFLATADCELPYLPVRTVPVNFNHSDDDFACLRNVESIQKNPLHAPVDLHGANSHLNRYRGVIQQS